MKNSQLSIFFILFSFLSNNNSMEMSLSTQQLKEITNEKLQKALLKTVNEYDTNPEKLIAFNTYVKKHNDKQCDDLTKIYTGKIEYIKNFIESLSAKYDRGIVNTHINTNLHEMLHFLAYCGSSLLNQKSLKLFSIPCDKNFEGAVIYQEFKFLNYFTQQKTSVRAI